MRAVIYAVWVIARALASVVWNALVAAGASLLLLGVLWLGRDYVQYACMAFIAIMLLFAFLIKIITIVDKDEKREQAKQAKQAKQVR